MLNIKWLEMATKSSGELYICAFLLPTYLNVMDL